MTRRIIIAIVAVCVAASSMLAGHTTLKLKLTDSKIFPGTSHSVLVTVPDSYTPDTPACLYMGLDGILCNAPAVIDTLIATGEMPVTIGVFVQSGLITDGDEVLRYNRSNEFDATDSRFATFIESELLPAVQALVTPDGRKVKLSAEASDHMIFGLSSGGIAAFTVGWSRPDLFAKIFSGCGTFVPMRGGQELQTLVRKSEPKALRVYLQDGFTDTWNPLFGSWYEANRMLASALEFAGYDCAFDWAEGGHSVRRATEIFPDVMRWMWRDYPSPVTRRPTANNLLAPLLIADADWQPATTTATTAGTLRTATYPDGSHEAHAVDGSNTLEQSLLAPDGSRRYTQRFYWLHDLDNTLLAIGGMAFDAAGNLWVVTNAGLQICDQNGRVRGILTLPADLRPEATYITIGDGSVTLTDGTAAYTRRFNVAAPTPGKRPASQGQG